MTNHTPAPRNILPDRAIQWANCSELAVDKRVTYLGADSTGDTLQLHKRHRLDAYKVFFANAVQNAGVHAYTCGEDDYMALREYTPVYKMFPPDLSQRLPKCNPKALEYYDLLEQDIIEHLQERNVPMVSGAGFFMTTSGLRVDIAVPDELFKFAGKYADTFKSKNNFAINLAIASLRKFFIDRPDELILEESELDI